MAWDLGSIVVALKLNVNDFTSNVESAFNTLQNTSKTSENALFSLGSQFQTVGSNLSQIFKPVQQFGIYAVQSAYDFELAMANVQAVSQATEEEFNLLKDAAREMGRETVFSATECADALYYMSLAGWDAQQSVTALEPILKLAAAGQIDLSRASDIVTDAITAFGYTAEDTTRFVDVLAQTMANSNTDVDQLGEAFKKVGTRAGDAGYSIEDVSFVLGLLANNGIKASTAGTSLDRMLASLRNPTDKAAAALNELGIELFNADGSSRNLYDVVVDLRTAFADLTDEEKAYYGGTITTQNGQRALNAILNTSEEDFDSLYDAIVNADGALDTMYDTITDTLYGSWKEFTSAVESLAITVGDILLPVLTTLIDFLTDLVIWFDNLHPAIQTVLTVFGLLLAGIGPLLSVIGSVIKVVGALKWVFSGIATVIGAVVSVLGWPVTILLALAAAFATAYAKSEKFRDIVDGVIKAVIGFFSDAWDAISKWFSDVGKWFGDLGNTIGEWVDSLVQWFIGLKDSIVELFTQTIPTAIGDFVNGTIETISGWVDSVVSFFTETVPEAFNSFVSFLGEIPYWIGYYIGLALAHIVNFAYDVGVFFTETIPQKIGEFISWMAELPGKIWEAIKSALEIVYEWGEGVWNTFSEWVTKSVNDVFTWFSELPGKVWNAIKGAWNKVTEWGSGVWSRFSDWVNRTITSVVDWFKQLPSKIWNAIKGAFDEVVKWGNNLKTKATEAGKKVVNAVVDQVKKIPGKMLSIGEDIVSGLWDGISSLTGWIGDKVSDFCDGVVSGFKKAFSIFSPSRVMRDEVGVYLGEGLGEGIDDSLPSVLRTVDEFADEIIDEMVDQLDEGVSVDLLDSLGQTLDYQPTYFDNLVESFREFVEDLDRITDEFGGYLEQPYEESSMLVGGEHDNMFSKGTQITNVTIENITVRNDSDLQQISRGLYNENARQQRANGLRGLT